mgnify:CR=1 FL=1
MPIMAIISAIQGVASLFDKGKEVYEQVTGKPSTAPNPQALGNDVMTLPADQVAAWTAAMAQEIELFKAGTERVRIEEGELSPEILKVLTPEAAAKVAILRMTTRPLIARWCAQVILMPAWMVAYDAIAMMLNGPIRFFWGTPMFDLFAEKIFGPGSVYIEIYSWAAPTAGALLLGYFGLRTKEKNANNGKTDTLVDTAMKAIGGVKAVLGRK